MFKLRTIFVVVSAGVLLFPMVCGATEVEKKSDIASASMAIDIQPKTVVLSNYTANVKPQPDAFVVQDIDGTIYFNHIVSDKELTNVADDIEVLRTYTFLYDGKTYTNKVVEFKDK